MAHIAAPLTLQPDQALQLESMLRQGTLEQRVAKRCRTLLLAAEGLGNTGIALRLGMHRNAIANIRGRFQNTGLACLEDMPRPGRPPSHSAEVKRRIVTMVCGKPPKGMSRWSIQSLAKRLGLSKSYVHSVLKEHDLHPHRLRTFNFSPDPHFEDKLLEMVGLYMNPPENALVLCMDEKTGIQALDRTQPVLPLRSGKPRCWSNEYVRHGTRTMPAAIDINSGRATTWVNKTRTAGDFVKFMNRLVREYPGQRLYVVMDNLNTHKGRLAQEWLEKNPLVTFYYTPTHASWVNLAECFFSILTRRGLRQSVHRSCKELERFLKDFVTEYNKTCGPFIWTKGPEKLKQIIRLTQSYQNQAHSN